MEPEGLLLAYNSLLLVLILKKMNPVYTLPYYFINTLWTGDTDLRLYITTVQDG
jgi:hypothetical protein